MAKSSIHIRAAKSTSESHNLRKRKFNYVREDLTENNFNAGFHQVKLSELRKEQASLYQEKVGQKMQKATNSIREGVFLITEKHTDDEIFEIVKDISIEFKIRPVQLSVHRDEGHYQDKVNKKNWVSNLHAHVVFDWQDKKTGKMHKLDKNDLSRMQTYFAEALGMERGEKSTKRHLESLAFKVKAEEIRMKKIKEENRKHLDTQEKELLKTSFYESKTKEAEINHQNTESRLNRLKSNLNDDLINLTENKNELNTTLEELQKKNRERETEITFFRNRIQTAT
jgi:hypothetical protein